MIAIDLALALRNAGLAWQPTERDCFAIPGGQFDGKVFSLNEQPALIELLHGYPVITFHGSTEWALDHLYTSEVVWVPSETQLREKIAHLIEPDAPFTLDRTSTGYDCRAAATTADGADAEEAYAQVLLAILIERNATN
jgi:hypothetical protein